MTENHYNLCKKVQDLETEVAKERCEKHYWIGYAKGIAHTLPEPGRSRVLEYLEKHRAERKGENHGNSNSKLSTLWSR